MKFSNSTIASLLLALSVCAQKQEVKNKKLNNNNEQINQVHIKASPIAPTPTSPESVSATYDYNAVKAASEGSGYTPYSAPTADYKPDPTFTHGYDYYKNGGYNRPYYPKDNDRYDYDAYSVSFYENRKKEIHHSGSYAYPTASFYPYDTYDHSRKMREYRYGHNKYYHSYRNSPSYGYNNYNSYNYNGYHTGINNYDYYNRNYHNSSYNSNPRVDLIGFQVLIGIAIGILICFGVGVGCYALYFVYKMMVVNSAVFGYNSLPSINVAVEQTKSLIFTIKNGTVVDKRNWVKKVAMFLKTFAISLITFPFALILWFISICHAHYNQVNATLLATQGKHATGPLADSIKEKALLNHDVTVTFAQDNVEPQPDLLVEVKVDKN